MRNQTGKVSQTHHRNFREARVKMQAERMALRRRRRFRYCRTSAVSASSAGGDPAALWQGEQETGAL